MLATSFEARITDYYNNMRIANEKLFAQFRREIGRAKIHETSFHKEK